LILFFGFNLSFDTQIAHADFTFLSLFEQEKSERLLLNILPASIAKRLKQKISTVADDFSKVSVLFADIVGFTEMSGRMSPPALVNLLNNIFSLFDKLVEQHGLEKIKTIGDAYMVVAGLPTPCQDHITQIADLALEPFKNSYWDTYRTCNCRSHWH